MVCSNPKFEMGIISYFRKKTEKDHGLYNDSAKFPVTLPKMSYTGPEVLKDW